MVRLNLLLNWPRVPMAIALEMKGQDWKRRSEDLCAKYVNLLSFDCVLTSFVQVHRRAHILQYQTYLHFHTTQLRAPLSFRRLNCLLQSHLLPPLLILGYLFWVYWTYRSGLDYKVNLYRPRCKHRRIVPRPKLYFQRRVLPLCRRC